MCFSGACQIVAWEDLCHELVDGVAFLSLTSYSLNSKPLLIDEVIAFNLFGATLLSYLACDLL